MSHDMDNPVKGREGARRIALAFALGAWAAVAVASDGGASTAITEAAVSRAAEGGVLVTWKTVPAGVPVDVAIALSGERQVRLVSDDDADGSFQLPAQEAARRPLFHLTPEAGQPLIVAERVLPLEGGRNFRDLGGYPTADGRRTKWGRIYRSGTMTNLTDADYEFLSTLGIRVVCDFRANEEREREPTLWRTSGPEIEYLTRDYGSKSSLREFFGADAPTADQVRSAMTRLYGELPYEHAPSYRRMFEQLAAGKIPLAFNCSAGKDRTGVAAALLLMMLGVPRETVVEDYALSERVVDYEAAFVHRAARTQQPGPWDFIAKLPAEVRAPLLRSDPDYIRSALLEIERREGSIDAYFARVLGVSPKERQQIRERLLE